MQRDTLKTVRQLTQTEANLFLLYFLIAASAEQLVAMIRKAPMGSITNELELKFPLP